jgi:hypothetical protein
VAGLGRHRGAVRHLGTGRAPCDLDGRRSNTAPHDIPHCVAPRRRLGRAPRFVFPGAELASREWQACLKLRGPRCRPPQSSTAKGRGAFREWVAERSLQALGTTLPTPWPPRRRDRLPQSSRRAASDRWTAERPATADRTHEDPAATTHRRPTHAQPQRPHETYEKGASSSAETSSATCM